MNKFLAAMAEKLIQQKNLAQQLKISVSTLSRWLQNPEQLNYHDQKQLAEGIGLELIHYVYDAKQFAENTESPAIKRPSHMTDTLFPAFVHQAMEYERLQYMLMRPLQRSKDIHPDLKKEFAGWYLGSSPDTSPMGDPITFHYWYLLQHGEENSRRVPVGNNLLTVLEYPESTHDHKTDWTSQYIPKTVLSRLQNPNTDKIFHPTENYTHFVQFYPTLYPINADSGDQAFYLHNANNHQRFPSDYLCLRTKGHVFDNLINLIEELNHRIRVNSNFRDTP